MMGKPHFNGEFKRDAVARSALAKGIRQRLGGRSWAVEMCAAPQWALIGPLLPSGPERWARPSGGNRRFPDGMPHVLRAGCP